MVQKHQVVLTIRGLSPGGSLGSSSGIAKHIPLMLVLEVKLGLVRSAPTMTET